MSVKPSLVPFALAAWAYGATANPSLASVDAVEEEVERYTRLTDDIRDFERFGNVEMNDLIFAGLHSGNPKVVDLAVAAVNVEAMYRYHRGGDYTAGFRETIGKRARDVVRIPGIRDFLIDYAQDGLAKHGPKRG